MRINYIKKVEMYDDETNYWAEYKWNSNKKVWHCHDGRASEGFFNTHPGIPRTMTDQQMTLLAIKG